MWVADIKRQPWPERASVCFRQVHPVCGWRKSAPLLQRRFLTAPYPLLNIDIEKLLKQICSNDGNLAPPQTEQLSMLKRGCGDASSSHRRCLLCRWCKISSIHSKKLLTLPQHGGRARVQSCAVFGAALQP